MQLKTRSALGSAGARARRQACIGADGLGRGESLKRPGGGLLRPDIAKLESRGSRGFREILDVSSLRTRVGFGFFVTQLADSKPQAPRRGIGDSRDEPGFWMGLPRTMNTGGFVTSRKWGFIEIKILKNRMKARVPRDDKPGFHLE